MRVDFADLLAQVPGGDWPELARLWPALAALDSCPQDPRHHAEGDAGTHTRMVLAALLDDPDWQALPEDERGVLFWATICHDVGKPGTTATEPDGRITSRGHSRLGAAMTRAFLAEAEAPFDWREAVCNLIAVHQLPFWLIERPDPGRLAIETSWRCRADRLCLHARADATGRLCADRAGLLDNVALAAAAFEEAGCLTAPYAFANAESRLGFFESEGRAPDYAAFEEFRCTVTLMSGLPGAGKDSWLTRNAPDLPVVSLDALRAAMGVGPDANQGRVVQAAFEAARCHLREGRDFAWNGTNVTRHTRGRALRLLRDYGARIRIVYLEPSLGRLRTQNRNRPDAVPEAVIGKLLDKLEPPDAREAHEVVYVVG